MNIELKNQLNELPRPILDALLEGLLAIRAWRENPDDTDSPRGGEFCNGDGICSALAECCEWSVLQDGHYTSAKVSLFRAWPESSGSTSYPVPGNEEDRAYYDEEYNEELGDWTYEDREHDDETLAEVTFDNTTDMWDGEYGARRLRLLNFMIDSLMEYLTVQEPKPEPVTAANYKPAHGGYPGVVR